MDKCGKNWGPAVDHKSLNVSMLEHGSPFAPQNCNLSSCDLQEANLRGANLKDAIFESLVTPLHMSQTLNTLRLWSDGSEGGTVPKAVARMTEVWGRTSYRTLALYFSLSESFMHFVETDPLLLWGSDRWGEWLVHETDDVIFNFAHYEEYSYFRAKYTDFFLCAFSFLLRRMYILLFETDLLAM